VAGAEDLHGDGRRRRAHVCAQASRASLSSGGLAASSLVDPPKLAMNEDRDPLGEPLPSGAGAMWADVRPFTKLQALEAVWQDPERLPGAGKPLGHKLGNEPGRGRGKRPRPPKRERPPNVASSVTLA
jgi:hypothetical protein